MVLLLALVIGTWFLAATAIVILCQATRKIDEELRREREFDADLVSHRLPFAS